MQHPQRFLIDPILVFFPAFLAGKTIPVAVRVIKAVAQHTADHQRVVVCRFQQPTGLYLHMQRFHRSRVDAVYLQPALQLAAGGIIGGDLYHRHHSCHTLHLPKSLYGFVI